MVAVILKPHQFERQIITYSNTLDSAHRLSEGFLALKYTQKPL